MKLISHFADLSQDTLQERLTPLVATLVDTLTEYLGLDVVNTHYTFTLTNHTYLKQIPDSIFDYGVERIVINNKIELKVYKNQIDFLPFILLREAYNLFIPKEVKNYEWVQLTINQMILADLTNHNKAKEWNILVRENVKLYDDLSIGYGRLNDFDRLAQLFKNPASKKKHYRLFFNLLREDPHHLPRKNDYIHIFFTDNLGSTYYSEDLLETIRCVTIIFHKIKTYRGITEYNKLFQQFKKNGSLQTDLSPSVFIHNMEFVKERTVIAPNYLVNWEPLKCFVISCTIRFNPLLNKAKIINLFAKLPFVVNPYFYYNGFNIELNCFFKAPAVYKSDVITFLRRLEGYIIESFYFSESLTKEIFYKNLNYKKDIFQDNSIPNPNNPHYNSKYELNCVRGFGDITLSYEPSLLDLIFIDLTMYTSTAGLGFERKDKILKTIKKEMMEAISSQRGIIKQLRETLNFFHSSKKMKDFIFGFIENNKKFGFFYLRNFMTNFVDVISILSELQGNISQIQKLVSDRNVAYKLEENLFLNERKLLDAVLKHIVPLLYDSRYIEVMEEYKKVKALFDCCSNLKLFDLTSIKKLIEDESSLTFLYSRKDKKLGKVEMEYREYKLTNQLLDERIESFLNNNPPIITPSLIGTIGAEKDSIQRYNRFDFILERSKINLDSLKLLVNVHEMSIVDSDSIEEKQVIEFKCLPSLYSTIQKGLLFSLMNSQLNIIHGKRYIGQGHDYATTLRNLFDSETKQFFYTKDLFEHQFKYVKAIFGDIPTRIRSPSPPHHLNLFSLKLSSIDYIKKMNNLREKPDYTIAHLTKLLHFHLQLKNTLFHNEQYQQVKDEHFFKKYIKTIKFKPSFGSFGFSQFYLFVDFYNLNEVDFKILFLNNFQGLKFPMCIENSIPLFIKYIYPSHLPNNKYLNWQTHRKKNVRSYCFYSVEKEYRIFQLDRNLSSEGWVYDKDKFKIYAERLLFRKDYNPQLPKIIELDFQELLTDTVLGHNSPEFQDLIKIYSKKSVDIKSFLGTKKRMTLDALRNLIGKNLIYPYLSLKNVGICETIRLILPETSPQIQEKLLQIFSFFNFCTVSKIKGKYFIHGFQKEKTFEKGTVIKISFPETSIGLFINIFINIFEYLKIEHYIILHDLIDGDHIIKSIFRDDGSIDSYNPLTNLIWNEKDKIWMNHKLFIKDF